MLECTVVSEMEANMFSLIDYLISKFQPCKDFYFKYVDDYTNMVLYFKVSVDRNNEETCTVVDDVPNSAKVEDWNGSGWEKLILHTKGKYLNNLDRLYSTNNFFHTNLYSSNFDEWAKENKELFSRYSSVLNTTMEKCQNTGIAISNCEDSFSQLINDINSIARKRHYERSGGRVSQINAENIDSEFHTMVENLDFDTSKFTCYRFMITNAIAAFWDNFSFFCTVLKKETYNEEEKKMLQKYFLFLSSMPRLFDFIRILDSYNDEILKTKMVYNTNKCKNNKDFISQIQSLIEKCDLSKERLFVHVATDLFHANSIMAKGLYVYDRNDITSFGSSVDTLNDILSYEYDGLVRTFDRFIILFRLSSPTEISSEVVEEAEKIIGSRRFTIMGEIPTGKLNSSDILGIIDRQEMKVYENLNFESSKNIKK